MSLHFSYCLTSSSHPLSPVLGRPIFRSFLLVIFEWIWERQPSGADLDFGSLDFDFVVAAPSGHPGDLLGGDGN